MSYIGRHFMHTKYKKINDDDSNEEPIKQYNSDDSAKFKRKNEKNKMKRKQYDSDNQSEE